ncbi:ImmA/IrrE family metallo-endopeptidase [Clostridium botulinum]|uniref:IrrE N-terminal-like domain-containing protein n=1 Tax=Clostridium botulinum TaxID=1491 RepID=A0A6G4ED91_CLOBO|nr:ImmA/IrrE family metallo-endopeptidase [Clostridium botulinum]AUM91547.1 hypothetical protein RSJ5_09770 [Clostridium botulinum]NFB12947.1 hypothetical protein [Clostridium botulinum]NFH57877.1 hypothetical protein [Clostridium botulinum]NFH61160.1 hypothetical protein [Clostridium botulinum]NFJ87250.1 hypothetical protein [Clostridium botulinum]
MNKYEKLISEAQKQRIEVIEINLGTDKPCGKCIDNMIFINSRINIKDKYCILAEELGHYHLTVGNITNQSKIENRKQECIARRWSNRKLVRILDIIRAHEAGTRNRYELAEFIGVSESFLDECINYYKAKYGTCFTIDNYTVYFEPTLGIVKMF